MAPSYLPSGYHLKCCLFLLDINLETRYYIGGNYGQRFYHVLRTLLQIQFKSNGCYLHRPLEKRCTRNYQFVRLEITNKLLLCCYDITNRLCDQTPNFNVKYEFEGPSSRRVSDFIISCRFLRLLN